MNWSHGPWMPVLAIVGLAWLLIAVLAHLQATWIVGVFGALDIVVGSIMANELVARRAPAQTV
jgi:cadmium resistance protein CadD (predicted permease)